MDSSDLCLLSGVQSIEQRQNIHVTGKVIYLSPSLGRANYALMKKSYNVND